MPSVLDYVRSKDPRFNEVPDDQLTLYVGDKSPDLLKDNDFRAQYATAKSARIAQDVTGTINRILSSPATAEASQAGQRQIDADTVRISSQIAQQVKGLIDNFMTNPALAAASAEGQRQIQKAKQPPDLSFKARVVEPFVGGLGLTKKAVGGAFAPVNWAFKKIDEALNPTISDWLIRTGIDPSSSPEKLVNLPKIELSKTEEELAKASRDPFIRALPWVAGLINLTSGTGESLTTGSTLALGPMMAGEGALAKTAAALFGSQQFAQLPEQVRNAISVIKDPSATTGQKVAAFGTPGVSALLGSIMIKGALRTERLETGETMAREAMGKTRDAAPATAAALEAQTKMPVPAPRMPQEAPDAKSAVPEPTMGKTPQEAAKPVEGGAVKYPTTPLQKDKLKLLGLSDADISDLETGKASVPDVVARKLPTQDRGPDHAAALEEARVQAVSDIEKVLAEKGPEYAVQQKTGEILRDVQQPEKPKEGAGQVPAVVPGEEAGARGGELPQKAHELTAADVSNLTPEGYRKYRDSLGKDTESRQEQLAQSTPVEQLQKHAADAETEARAAKQLAAGIDAQEDPQGSMDANTSGIREVAGKEASEAHDAGWRWHNAVLYQELKRRGLIKGEIPALEKYIGSKSKDIPVEAAPPAPSKFRLKNEGPQTYTVVERLPATEVEKANGEQPVRVKNDKTGAESVVLESQLEAVKDRTIYTASTSTPRVVEHTSVPIDFIDSSQTFRDNAIVEKYRQDIRQGKPLDLIRVVLNPKTGRFSVTDGHHRYEAAKLEGLKTIPVKEEIQPYERKLAIGEGIRDVGTQRHAGSLTRREGTKPGFTPGPSEQEKIGARPYTMAGGQVRGDQPSTQRHYGLEQFESPEAYGKWVQRGRPVSSTGEPITTETGARKSGSIALDDELRRVGLDPSSFKNRSEKRAALRRAKAKGKGPGTGAGPGTPAAAQGPDPKSQIESLEESFRGIRGKRVPLSQQVKQAFAIGDKVALAKDMVSRAISSLKSTGDYLIKKWEGYNTIDDMLRAKGELSAELEKRGWRVRQFVKTTLKAVPDKLDQAGISKYVDAGGDLAELQRGLTEAPDKYKPTYQRAIDIANSPGTSDLKIAAENLRNYFESRLQEAIDAGVLETGVEDYIHRLYERDPAAAQRLNAYAQSGILKTRPGLSKKRIFDFDWEAEKLGYRPVQSFVDRTAAYETSLSRAIAARKFIQKMVGYVDETTGKKVKGMTAKDGRPVIDVGGMGSPVEDAAGVREATLIRPSFKPRDETNPLNNRSDYATREYSALRKWRWATTDAAGKPIFVQGDLLVHPDYAGRVDALLKPSGIRYARSPVARGVGRAALGVGSTIKQTMLDFSGFHQVQIAIHALEHRVQPGRIPIPGTGISMELPRLPFFEKVQKGIDFEDPDVDGLMKGGVTLGGEYRTSAIGEGLVGRSISRLIPGVNTALRTYHEYLFQDFIPRVKMSMALGALERNKKRFSGELASGKMGMDEIYQLTANQANAAFGELNYITLERSKTMQDAARLIFLAPDFLEARGRFATQAFMKHGNEQRIALALGALFMYSFARVANTLINGQPHLEPENMFSIVHNGKAYGLRTVQGDLLHLFEKPFQFWLSRLNPVFGRTLLEAASGRDYFGRKRTAIEQVWDAVSTAMPVSLRSSRERALWESLLNGFGVTARRWNDVDDAFKLAQKWKEAHGVGLKGEFIYDATKDPLRPLKIALSNGDEGGAVKEIKRLTTVSVGDLVETSSGTGKVIDEYPEAGHRVFKITLGDKSTVLKKDSDVSVAKTSAKKTIAELNTYFDKYASMPFTGSAKNDRDFISTLNADQKITVRAASEHKKALRDLYRKSREQYRAAMQNPPTGGMQQ